MRTNKEFLYNETPKSSYKRRNKHKRREIPQTLSESDTFLKNGLEGLANSIVNKPEKDNSLPKI